MPVLFRASFGFLIRHPWQLALALLGISIGVAVMVAVDLANASSRKAFLLSMDTLNGQATHQVVGGPRGVPEQVYVRLRTDARFRDIAPVVEGIAAVGGSLLTVLGIDVFAEQGFRNYTVPGANREGDTSGTSGFDELRRFLIAPGGVLLTQRTAESLGLRVAQDFDLEVGGRRRSATVLGLLDTGADSAQLDNLLIADIATVQEWQGGEGYLSRVDVRLPANPDLQAALEALLPPGTTLKSAAGRTQTTADMTAAFMTNLTAMSLLALLVGVFLIYNSVGFAVVQRRGLIGVLRALGLTRRQAFFLVMNESILLGVVGALLGVTAGVWLGEQLLQLVSRSINDLYFRVAVTDLSLDPWSLGKGLGAGLAATLLAAAVPAWEAAGLQPALTLKRSLLERRTGRLAPLLLVAGLAGVAAAGLLLAVSGDSLFAGLVALFLLILGFGLCIPSVVLLLTRCLSPFAGTLAGTSARLALDGIQASLSRTGVAIVALAVAVSATIGVSVMVDSFRVAVSDWLGTTLQSDVYVGVERGSMDSSLIADIARLDGVREFSSNRRAWIESATGRTRVIALSMATGSYAGTELLDADTEAAWRAFDNEEGILVSDPYAYRNDVAAGGRVSLDTNRGRRGFTVAAVYRSYDANQGAIVMSRDTYDRYWSDDGVDSMGLYLEDGTDADALMDRIRELASGRQAVRMNSNSAIKDISLAIFDRTFVITDVLYWLAVGVAIIGILGAMLALQLERARELAVLRALGMTPAQLGAMVVAQTGLIGLLSGMAAIPLGLVMAWVLIDVINRRSFGWQMEMTVDPGILAAALALSVCAALAAGLYPAYRAASSSPAAAMREE